MARMLEGKIALITGTGGGQGRAAALRFAAEGARVVGCDVKVEGAKKTVEMVRTGSGEMVSLEPLDLSEEANVKRWIDFAVQSYGDFDILYNNASMPRFGMADDMPREDWDFCMANEVTLVYLAIKHAIPVFRRKGCGVIINTASIAGMEGGGAFPGGLAHAVAKAGIIQMTRFLANELAPLKIRVNAISPGGINTPAVETFIGDPNSPFRKVLLASQLVQRIGESEDIANAAVFLASEQASFITGINLPVEGGATTASGITSRGLEDLDSTVLNH